MLKDAFKEWAVICRALADGGQGLILRKGGIGDGITGSQPGRGARAQPLDRAADHKIGQRHPFGGIDHAGDETHVAASFCGGSGKNMLVRD